MRNAWLEEAQAGIKTAGRNINNLRYTDDTTLIAESKECRGPAPADPEYSKRGRCREDQDTIASIRY